MIFSCRVHSINFRISLIVVHLGRNSRRVCDTLLRAGVDNHSLVFLIQHKLGGWSVGGARNGDANQHIGDYHRFSEMNSQAQTLVGH